MKKEVFVFIEQRGGVIQLVSFELLGEATRLAAQAGSGVTAVLMGDHVIDLAKELFRYGAGTVLVVDHPALEPYTTEPYTKALCHLIQTYHPEIVLYGATDIGRDLAPRVAGRIHTGLTADCTGLEIDAETGLLQMTRPAFGGNLMATIVCKDYRPQMATVRPGVMAAADPSEEKQGEIVVVDAGLSLEDRNVTLLGVTTLEGRKTDITAERILISGGRGIGSAEGFHALRELADVLEGEVAGSRIAVEQGWIGSDCQVGQTGKTVRPNLYMACGISGAIQHMAGMEQSSFILAINTDASCPMMKMADLGIVGDVKQIIPALVTALRSRQAAAR